MPRLDLGDIKKVIDQAEQMTARAMDVPDIFLVVGMAKLAERLGAQQLGKADDGIERRAQFMAHIGEKLRFRAIGKLRHFLCLAQGDLGPHTIVHIGQRAFEIEQPAGRIKHAMGVDRPPGEGAILAPPLIDFVNQILPLGQQHEMLPGDFLIRIDTALQQRDETFHFVGRIIAEEKGHRRIDINQCPVGMGLKNPLRRIFIDAAVFPFALLQGDFGGAAVIDVIDQDRRQTGQPQQNQQNRLAEGGDFFRLHTQQVNGNPVGVVMQAVRLGKCAARAVEHGIEDDIILRRQAADALLYPSPDIEQRRAQNPVDRGRADEIVEAVFNPLFLKSRVNIDQPVAHRRQLALPLRSDGQLGDRQPLRDLVDIKQDRRHRMRILDHLERD